MIRRLCLWLLACLPLSALAQGAGPADPAILVADRVLVEGQSRLVAEGNVEALHDGTRLNARRIVYDQDSGVLTVEGPVRLVDPEGNVLIADSAELERDFEAGLLRGARLVLDQQLQLAAVEARRIDGRYTALNRVAVTSCQVCGADQVPLWQIRASRVIHDEVGQQIYFDHAQFRILDVPVAYLPRLRVPDPTLERARGFLTPTLRSSTLLGFGIKVPYFVPVGPHQDFTFTPYLSPVTKTLETRYRRAFRYGDLEVNTAISRDTLRNDETRAYLFAEGAFQLPRRFRLDFDIETVTDEAYLDTYDYSGKDRLDSAVTLSRTTADSYFELGAIHYETLRDDESDATQPTIILDGQWERRFFPKLYGLGGEVRLGAEAHGHLRYSDRATDGPDADAEIDGRDVARLTAEASWQRRWTLAGGVRAGLSTHLWADRFRIRQDVTSAERAAQLTPGVAADLRWPWVRTGAGGARYLIEPLLQTAWIGGDRLDIPNDESTRVEFDEGNLEALSRFPAADRRERGRVTVAGLRWMRRQPEGWSAGLALGQVWRAEEDGDFSRSSGLDSGTSDLLVAGHIANAEGLRLTARGLLEDAATSVSKAEARASWETARFEIGASYLLIGRDPDEDREAAQSEWSFDGAYNVNESWSTDTFWRYDLVEDRLSRAGLGIAYETECIEVGFSVSRRFASSTNLEPSTDYGLSVALKGFGGTGSAKERRRTCKSF
ncbi:LPS-assembly protein LptD [Roseivivax sp. CAU 1761]